MITQITFDSEKEMEVTIAYSGSTVVLGLNQAENLAIINMSSSFAIHLMMELREALNDLHSEPGESDE